MGEKTKTLGLTRAIRYQVMQTTREQEVVDILHGVPIADPYRWLEDGDSEETRAWVALQNTATRMMLDAAPHRGTLHAQLDSVGPYETRMPISVAASTSMSSQPIEYLAIRRSRSEVCITSREMIVL